MTEIINWLADDTHFKIGTLLMLGLIFISLIGIEMRMIENEKKKDNTTK